MTALARYATLPLALLLAAPSALAQVGSSAWLTFELGAPCEIAQAVAASNEYAAEGVTFEGATPGAGPVVLSDCGSLGFDAYRGQGMIVASETGVSQSGSTAGPITMLFSPPADRLTYRVGSAAGSGNYYVTFYSGPDVVYDSYIGASGWVLFSVGLDTTFDRVVIGRFNPDESVWGLDEVSVVRTGTGVGNVMCDGGTPFITSATSLMATGDVTGGGPYTSLDFSVVGGPRSGIGILLASPDGTYQAVPGGVPYLGQICVGQPIRRIGVLLFNEAGFVSSTTSLNQLPGPLAGQRWYFQAWHRFDSPYANGYGSTGFSNSLEIDFQ